MGPILALGSGRTHTFGSLIVIGKSLTQIAPPPIALLSAGLPPNERGVSLLVAGNVGAFILVCWTNATTLVKHELVFIAHEQALAFDAASPTRLWFSIWLRIVKDLQPSVILLFPRYNSTIKHLRDCRSKESLLS